MPTHRSDRLENLWRDVVPWLLRHSDGVLPYADIVFLQELLSLVAISDPQRSRLTDILSQVIAATCKRPWDDPARWQPTMVAPARAITRRHGKEPDA